MTADLELGNYSKHTRDAYLRIAKAFIKYYRRPADELGEQDVRAYLLNRLDVVQPATVAVDHAALKFLFDVTLNRPEVVARIPWPKVPKSLPDILSGSEVVALLEAVESLKHRTILTAAYGAGLRINEACSLGIDDVDSKRMLIKVRKGKGKKDRYVMLAQNLLIGLRTYYRAARPKRPWLFPGAKAGARITAEAVRKDLRKAIAQAGVTKRVTPHTLRHAFATHLLETGADIRTVQALLGHASIRSTQRYTQVSAAHVARTKSPLDRLGTQDGAVLG
ncbi:MAG: tyrosine-type recombinase/integrase [bacterium]|nr:tyrosine-type recombinase/integrase [bacterium]